MNTWLHFIGDNYRDDYRFILEARRNGISRNVPLQVARGFHYGDRVQLLRWKRRGNLVYAFAEMVVSSVVMPHEISQQVIDKMVDKMELSYDPSPLHIDRDCGSYDICGTWTVSDRTDIPDIIRIALEVAGDKKLKCMIGGYLIKIYDKPIRILGVKFTRGFQKSDIQSGEPIEDEVRQILGIRNYRRN